MGTDLHTDDRTADPGIHRDRPAAWRGTRVDVSAYRTGDRRPVVLDRRLRPGGHAVRDTHGRRGTHRAGHACPWHGRRPGRRPADDLAPGPPALAHPAGGVLSPA